MHYSTKHFHSDQWLILDILKLCYLCNNSAFPMSAYRHCVLDSSTVAIEMVFTAVKRSILLQ